MAKKQMLFKTKGMNRDLSVSAFNPEFSFENMNLRLSTNEGNTLMSWVNEKGTEPIKDSEDTELTLNGCVIGTAIINQYLVLFLTQGWDSTNNKYFDSIYRLEYLADKKRMKYTQLYSGQLGFSIEHPLETLVSYESKNIQKVYWTDGINQPRLINIAPKINGEGQEVTEYNDTSFDFIPTLKLEETIKVQKVLGGGGMFAPGVIQYAFTYYRKYGQESNIFYTTPLYYISHADRGASPEDKVDNIFKITIENVDKDNNFDYLRIYSIQRTSINGTPICKRIQDIAIDGLSETQTESGVYKASYIDTGLSGDAVDPTELLYIGGVDILAGTMEQKDNTLFMGDLTVAANLKPYVVGDITLRDDTRTFYPTEVSTKNYVYASQLTAFKQVTQEGSLVKSDESVPCAGFKHGNYYRCGVQFQDKTGKWSDPIFIADKEITQEPSIAFESQSQTDPGSTPGSVTPYTPTPNPPVQDLFIGIYITNSSQNALSIENVIKIGFNDGTLMDVRLSSSSPVRVAVGTTQFYNAVALNAEDYVGKKFASSTVCTQKGWHNNILVYDTNHGNVNNYDFYPLNSSETFQSQTAYTLVCYNSPANQPSPTPTPVTDFKINLSIVSNVQSYSTGEIKFYVGGHYGVWANLPNSSSSSNVYSFGQGTTSLYTNILCMGNGVDVATLEERTLDGDIIVYAFDGTTSNQNMVTATITGESNKLRNGGSYTITITAYNSNPEPQPTPTPSGNPVINFNVRITNNTESSVALDGRLRFVLGNPDHNGVYYGGYMGEYIRTDNIWFSNDAVILSTGETRTYSNLTWRDADTGNGLGETSPLTPNRFPILDENGNVAYARNVLLYTEGRSDVTLCNNLSENIIFQEGGTYDIVIVSTNSQSRSGNTRSMTRSSDTENEEPVDEGLLDESPSIVGASASANPAIQVPSSPIKISVPIIEGTILEADAERLYEQGYRKARAVVVYPNMNDRVVLCQGVACPTVYTMSHRGTAGALKDNYKDIYAQSSWFFRPYYSHDSDNVNERVNTPYGNPNSHIPNMVSGTSKSPSLIKRVEVQGNYNGENQFSVDWETVTLHSPEVEFDSNMHNIDYEGGNLECYRRGTIGFTKTFSDIDIQTETPTISGEGGGFVKKSYTENYSYGIIAGLFYDDWVVDDFSDPKFKNFEDIKASVKWMVYPWNRSGSLNNDINRPANAGIASAILKKKIISNLRYAETALSEVEQSTKWQCNPALFSSDQPDIIKLKGIESDYSNIYQGNIDTLLMSDGADGSYFACNGNAATTSPDFTDKAVWKTFAQGSDKDKYGLWHYDGSSLGWVYKIGKVGKYFRDVVIKKDSVRMKYKSTPHLVLKGSSSLYTNLSDNFTMPIMELRRSDISASTLFGGTSQDALRENVWIPCGEPVLLSESNDGETGEPIFNNVIYKYEYGDTYYQRWDCLKTYAFTPEDINQVVEIGSFMLETYVNIDGRYDRNRGQLSNLYMSPQNFNLLNPVYSQLNNFFSYRIQDEDAYKEKHFPNQITWSKTKTSGADVDLWTNVTLASILELDGDKGKVRRFARFNDKLLCFQDTAVAQILYNENTMLSTTEGVPVEIGNSGKVQGKGYISDSIGCSNKWSVCSTPSGIYFMDSYNKAIYMYNGQLNSLSASLGMNTWCKNNIPDDLTIWTPSDYLEDNGTSEGELVDGFQNFVTYNDKLNRDILFINKTTALAFSEGVGTFTSLYDYGESPYFCNFSDTGVWARVALEEDVEDPDTPTHNEYTTSLWKHQAGDYCKFFGELKPYWMTMVANPEPLDDKIFTNLEFRASVDGDGEMETIIPEGEEEPVETGRFIPTLPFTDLETWNEYQHGYTTLENKNGHSLFQHGGDSSALKRKFRIWRSDIPRNNCLLGTPVDVDYSWDESLGISRKIRKPLDRMRNPWLYIKLKKRVEVGDDSLPRAELHDLVITYFK